MRYVIRAFAVIIVLSFALLFESGNELMAAPLGKFPVTGKIPNASAKFETIVNSLYCEANLEQSGLRLDVFTYAYKGYLKLLEDHKIARSNVITICDFSQSSRNRRLYVVDLETKKILVNTFVAHGRGSGGEYAKTFSNRRSSHKSSLGFYVTEMTYTGKHGYAMKLHGLEKGINDKADKRNIVVHGSKYVGEDFIRSNRYNGRSFGCPAVPDSEVNDVIESMKGGSCFFIYHPTKKYLTGSKILNS